MEAAFCASGLPARGKPLTRDRGLVTFPTAAALLTVLGDRLSEKPEDRGLALRVLAQAEERALAEGDILGRHFVYHQIIRLHSRWKGTFADAVDLIFAACHKQIQLAPEAAQALRQMRPDEPLPTHLGYLQASALLEQEGRYEPAIELCKQAQAGGWSGNWSWRIQRMARKLYEQGPSGEVHLLLGNDPAVGPGGSFSVARRDWRLRSVSPFPSCRPRITRRASARSTRQTPADLPLENHRQIFLKAW